MFRLLAVFLIALLPNAVRAEWREASTRHFLIYSEAPEKELRRHAERLEALHWLMLAANGAKDEEQPYKVRVYLVYSTDAVKRLYGDKNTNVAGFYRPLAAGPIAVVPRNAGEGNFGEIVLYHEYGHHFMLQYFPNAYPAWYVEGWAELVSTASFETKGKISYGKAASHRQYDLELSRWIPIRDLLTKSFQEVGAAYRSGFYGQSWLLAHYLTFSESRKGQLRTYLEAINAGRSFEQAASAFGDLDALNRELRGYLAARNFQYRHPDLPPNLAQNVSIRALGGAQAALMPETLEFTRTMDEAAAKAFAQRLRAKATAWASDPYALQLLAEVEYDSDEIDAAAESAARLLALAPGSPRALYINGAIALKQAATLEGNARENGFKAARKLLSAANAADPEDPLPRIALFNSYGEQGRTPPEAVVESLYHAMLTVPQDDGVRLTLASYLIATGRKAQAIAILRPLAFDPHGSGGAKAARDMIDSIEGRKPAPDEPESDAEPEARRETPSP